MNHQVISANRLHDGLVVYLTDGGNWSEHITAALVVTGEEEGETALKLAGAAVEARIVVDPYLIDIDVSGGKRRPTRFRELIRAEGPTVRPDIGKQAEL
jgi:hypothetical protein